MWLDAPTRTVIHIRLELGVWVSRDRDPWK